MPLRRNVGGFLRRCSPVARPAPGLWWILNKRTSNHGCEDWNTAGGRSELDKSEIEL